MKKCIYFVLAFIAMSFVACSADDELVNVENNQQYTIIGELPQPMTTRTVATDESDAKGYAMSFEWKTGDEVRFHYIFKDDAWQSVTKTSTITNGKATFTLGSHPAANSYIYGCTNVNLNTSKTSDATTASTANFYLNNERYIFTSMEDIAKYNPMFGVIPVQTSDTEIPSKMQFKNVCSILKFTVKLPVEVATVSAIKIRGYNKSDNGDGIQIKQNLQITGSTGAAEFISTNYDDDKNKNATGSYEVTGKTFGVTDGEIVFYAIMIPQELKGLYLQLNSSDTYKKTKKFAAPITLEAGKMYGVKLDFTK